MLHGKKIWRSRTDSGKGRFFRKSLIMIFIVSGIPGLIIGGLIYWMAGGRVESELLQLHYQQIEQRSEQMDDQLSNLELLLSHWAFDNKFDYSLNGLDFVRDFKRTDDITKTLIAMQGSNALVKKAELYVGGKSRVLFNPEYTPLQDQQDLSIYGKLIHGKNLTYWTQWAFDSNHPEQKDLTLVHHIPGGSPNPFGVLVFRFDGEKIASLLQTMTPYYEGEAFLQQKSGDLFVSANGSASNSDFVQALREKINGLHAGKGSFFFDWKGSTYTVSYGSLSRISDEWLYVSASPINSIIAPVMFISKLVITVSLIALLLAALLSWLASHRIYSPVKRLANLLGGYSGGAGWTGKQDEFALIEQQYQHLHKERLELNSKLAEQLPHVKESFLHQLLQGYLYAYSEEDLLRRMEKFKWEVRGRHFAVLFIQLNGIANMDETFRSGDEGLVTFAAVNMMKELASKHFEQSDTLNFHDLTAGIMLFIPEGSPYKQAVEAFSEELTTSVNRILRMRVTLAVSRQTAFISDLPNEFERVKQAVSYRNCDNANQIIDMEQGVLGGEAWAELQYPFTLERELVQALRTGKEEEAGELLGAFVGALSCAGAKEIDVQQGMLHLLGNIQHVIMVSGVNPNRLFKGVNLYEQLSQIREPKRMLAWFRDKVLAPYQKELSCRAGSEVKRLIEAAMIYMQQHYRQDISLDNCAEHIGTNPFYLSKSFKVVTGKNFIDYLTELRIERAKELLRESELKINDVAEQVGYQHSYFNRIFKKLEGMTPTSYREQSQHL
ncbi:AraC family transcriptional regulator [Paenibacillus sp. BK033]|uniref:helix-turn-helix domain-containing protein n=1 Tax=Paenibacillus sp. BK033 TaxID=2512133 RepID=UPI001044E653|nr:helix-turn-helix domain-containing protein [Paenibacillus sp. BK033]TCM99549.1 AraC family transcriptional regulator [Paenibacillus sp. BK033]